MKKGFKFLGLNNKENVEALIFSISAGSLMTGIYFLLNTFGNTL